MNRGLLVRTPVQHADESPAGYVLRLSEANGYETPRTLFALVGIGRDQAFTARLDVAKLAPVLGANGVSLRGYGRTDSSDAYSLMLAGHTLASTTLNLGCERICPECVRQLGYLPAWHDLRLIDGCPAHRRALLSVCDSCSQRIDWRRPGLLRCRCGADLGAQRGEALGPAHADLLEIVVAKLLREDPATVEALPLELLGQLSLGAVLALIENLAALERSGVRDRSPVAIAGEALSQWPDGVRAALDRWMGTSTATAGAPVRQRSAQEVMRLLLRDITAVSDVAVLRGALDALLGEVAAVTVSQQRVREGKKRRHRQRRRLSPAAPRPAALGHGNEALSMREAARFIGVPVSVLTSLRRSAHFVARHRTAHVASVHPEDALAFRKRLCALVEQRADTGGAPVVTLAEVFRRKLKYGAGKAEIVVAMLEGRLRVVGQQGSGVETLELVRDELDEFVSKARAAAFGSALTPTEVARTLDCCPLVVPDMVKKGYLQGHVVPAGLRVGAESVQDFTSQYRCMASLARELGGSSRAIGRRLAEVGVPALSFVRITPGRGEFARQLFIRHEDVPALLAHLTSERQRRTAATKGIVGTASSNDSDTGQPSERDASSTPACPACRSTRTGRCGHTPGGKARRQCKDCGRTFVEVSDPRRLTGEERAQVHALAGAGLAMAEIARQLGKGYKAVRNALRQA